MKKNKIILLILVAIIAGALLTSFRKAPEHKSENKNFKLTISTTTAQIQNIQDIVKLSGTVLPEEEVQVSPKTSGDIVQVNVDSGSYVRAGQILAKIDDSDLQIAKQEALARLAEVKASADISKANLNIAKVNHEKAQKDKARYLKLYSQGAISAQDFDNTATNLEISSSQLQKAYEENEYITQARINQVKANLNSINKSIQDCLIKAPVSGYIVKRDVELGTRVSSNDIAFTIARNSQFELQANVSESDLFKLKPGQTVNMSSSANPDLLLTGTIKKIEPFINPDSRIGNVKIALPADKRISYGMFLNGTVTLSNAQRIVIPEESVLFRNNKNIVFKVNNNIAQEAEIAIGSRNNGNVAVTSGLNPNEVIVKDGAGFLFDGDKVEISK